MKSGVLRFAFLFIFFLFIFVILLMSDFKDWNQEKIQSFKLEKEEEEKPPCLLLAVSPYFEEKKEFGSKNILALAEKEFLQWGASLRNQFKNSEFLFYLPLSRTKDAQWLIFPKSFFSSDSDIIKISHWDFTDIQQMMKLPSEEVLMTLKRFLYHFPDAKVFLDVFETDAQKGSNLLNQMIQTSVFITSKNERLLDFVSQTGKFKVFYSFKYLIRFQFLGLFQKKLLLPGSGIMIPAFFSATPLTIKKIKQQSKLVFLRWKDSLNGYNKSLAGSIDGIIISSRFLQQKEFMSTINFCLAL